ncbi:MAG TPA: Asp-tRNA(Asn)/Glu-tRNA(Gln) amidotransferase subunit GatC [Clostridiales bacterium]|nr:Asp-tRNA(Asn)/Glu-tRNA(Gln) amidotransferase subunit GatC [Clostridiales bacterium]
MTSEEFDELALKSKIKFSDEEKNKAIFLLDNMLYDIQSIENLDTEGLDIMVTPLQLENVFRDDNANESYKQKEILNNASNINGDYFSIPKVIKD